MRIRARCPNVGPVLYTPPHERPVARSAVVATLLAALLPGCPEQNPPTDASENRDTGSKPDLALDTYDAGFAPDVTPDVTETAFDTGSVRDAGTDEDVGVTDTGLDVAETAVDSGPPDVGMDVRDVAAPDVFDASADVRDVTITDTGSCTPLAWRTQHVSSGGNWGGSTAIAVDSSGAPHIVLHRAVYGSYGARELLYASLNASGMWDLEPIITGTGNDRDDTTDLVFDPSGTPHVVFPGLMASGPHPTFHATRTPTGWVTTPMRGGNTWASLAVDPRGVVHVASGQTEIHYASRASAGTWTHETERPSRCPSITVAADGTAYVVYATSPAGTAVSDLYLATRSPSGTWQHERVEGLAYHVDYVCETNIAVSSTGALHLVYAHAMGLRHATRPAGGTWAFQNLGPGRSSSLAVDARGGAHVSFGAELTYAYLPPGGAWRTTVVDSRPGGVPGADTSIAVDATGAVHIASYDESARTSPTYPIYYTTGRVCPP